MTSEITTRRIIACQTTGNPGTWLYLSHDLRQRHGAYDLSRFNDRALSFQRIAELTPEMRGAFDAVAEAVGLGAVDWTDLRVTKIESVRAQTDTHYDALSGETRDPDLDALEDDVLAGLAGLGRARAQNLAPTWLSAWPPETGCNAG